MKKLLLVSALSASLFSCSLLQRHGETMSDGEASTTATEAGEDHPLFTPDGQEIVAQNDKSGATTSGETEASRLNTKIAALETKVDVLSANLERLQAEKSQPVIRAEPQTNLAAPVGEATTEIQDSARSTEVSAAPARPARHLPVSPKEVIAETEDVPAKAATGAEKEFRAGMELFQNGQNLEAASRFALMAKKFPHHMLAAHALYWAGEAASRAQQWSIASENWVELEKKYPHSAYMPDALAGIAKAYEAQGDAAKAKIYKTLLLRSFPKSPVAMKSGVEPLDTASMAAPARRISRASEPAAEPPTSAGEEPAPVFEDDNGGGKQNSRTGTTSAPDIGTESQ